MTNQVDSFKSKKSLSVGNKSYQIFDLQEAQKNGLGDLSELPRALKVLLENLLRHEDGKIVQKDQLLAFSKWLKQKKSQTEIAFHPARVLMQDFTGVPAIVDLAAMRDAMTDLGGDAQEINPLVPVDLVIDHSVSVDSFGRPGAFEENVKIEFERNQERYQFLKWGQQSFENFRVVPPGTGICHQVNLEYLGQVVFQKKVGDETLAYCDTLVGTDSHTTMINGLSVLGWGVGGIEAEAAMLGRPVSMILPEVVGLKLEGQLKEGTTATDLVLTVTQILRKHGVVGKFVEFFGPGVGQLSLADRATIANMAPEYGATCGFFPIDEETLRYLRFTGRPEEQVQLVEAYARQQGLWRKDSEKDLVYSDILRLQLEDVVPSIAGPKRPQDKIELSLAAEKFAHDLKEVFKVSSENTRKRVPVTGEKFDVGHGDVVIAAITSCTNTSNPSVMMAAGLLAKKAVERGLKVKPWVKTSLAPGSQVVTDYFLAADLQAPLNDLGFNLVGYGCTTCIGNSGPLPRPISDAIEEGDLVATSVLSGNRNFEGRINSHVQANYLASPPLVVAYAIAGNLNIDITKDSLGKDPQGNDVYLKDIWPSKDEIIKTVEKALTPAMFDKRYSDVFSGEERWKSIELTAGLNYQWQGDSTYIKDPPYFQGMSRSPSEIKDITQARTLAVLGDSVTTDHISPAGAIAPDSPAGRYLKDRKISPQQFNSYGSRRGNHEVMMRGTFANIRIKNEMLGGKEGGLTRYFPGGEVMPIYDAAMKYQKENRELVVVAGKEYGTGSSRDWAAKGTLLLGVRAVIVESFERIHRSNLIGMGVLPLQFQGGQDRKSLSLTGEEIWDIKNLSNLGVGSEVSATVTTVDGEQKELKLLCRLDTEDEFEYYRHGGILQYVLRKLC